MFIHSPGKLTLYRRVILLCCTLLFFSVLAGGPHVGLCAEQSPVVTATSVDSPALLWLAKIGLTGILILVSFGLIILLFTTSDKQDLCHKMYCPGQQMHSNSGKSNGNSAWITPHGISATSAANPHAYPLAWTTPLMMAQPVMMVPPVNLAYQVPAPVPAQTPGGSGPDQPSSSGETHRHVQNSHGAQRKPHEQLEVNNLHETDATLAKYGFEIVHHPALPSTTAPQARPQSHADNRLVQSILQENIQLLQTPGIQSE